MTETQHNAGGLDLGGLLSQLTGGQGGGALAKLLPALMPMLAGGGLSKLIGQLNQGGLGSQAKSWVDTSASNAAVSPQQMTEALGDDKVHQLASQAGLSDQEAAKGLAAALPHLVNGLTPDGQVPQAAQLPGPDELKSQLGKFMGGATPGGAPSPNMGGNQ